MGTMLLHVCYARSDSVATMTFKVISMPVARKESFEGSFSVTLSRVTRILSLLKSRRAHLQLNCWLKSGNKEQ